MQDARTVRVGQGNIRDRLGAHRNDEEITAYEQYGTLRVTWATTGKAARASRERIERYVADQLDPLVGEYPAVEPLAVNLPW